VEDRGHQTSRRSARGNYRRCWSSRQTRRKSGLLALDLNDGSNPRGFPKDDDHHLDAEREATDAPARDLRTGCFARRRCCVQVSIAARISTRTFTYSGTAADCEGRARSGNCSVALSKVATRVGRCIGRQQGVSRRGHGAPCSLEWEPRTSSTLISRRDTRKVGTRSSHHPRSSALPGSFGRSSRRRGRLPLLLDQDDYTSVRWKSAPTCYDCQQRSVLSQPMHLDSLECVQAVSQSRVGDCNTVGQSRHDAGEQQRRPQAHVAIYSSTSNRTLVGSSSAASRYFGCADSRRRHNLFRESPDPASWGPPRR